jgi:hypothetical protein
MMASELHELLILLCRYYVLEDKIIVSIFLLLKMNSGTRLLLVGSNFKDKAYNLLDSQYRLINAQFYVIASRLLFVKY